MTRFRLAAIAALTVLSLSVMASVGQAQRETRYRSTTGCKTKHTMTRDFAKFRTEVAAVGPPTRGPGRRGAATAVQPVEGAKVITKLFDETPPDGNVLTFKQKKTTNENGVARTRHEFNNFGNYRFTVKVKVDGEVVATDERTFGVSDRVSGPCGAPLGAGEA
ncbi:MAG: hypothetical protein ACRDJY_03125 [Thermoleophilaceae bacterium]